MENLLTIETKNIIKSIAIKDFSGREVLYIDKNENMPIDVSKLSAGIYFVEIFTQKQAHFIAKFVKTSHN